MQAAKQTNGGVHLRHIVYYTVKTKLNLARPDKVLILDKPIYKSGRNSCTGTGRRR